MQNKNLKIVEEFDVESHVIEGDISYRGGTLKVDVSSVFPNVSNPVMGAYQNYLGGGIAGAIIGGAQFTPDELNEDEKEIFTALLDKIKKYFYSLNNGGGDDYMTENVNSFKNNQKLPSSGC
jgi:hypothetical protein